MMYENSGLEPSGREDVLEEAMFRSFRIYELKSVNSIPTAGEIDYTRKFSGSYHWSYDFEHQSAATRGPIKSPEIVLAHAETLVRAALEPLNSRAKGISAATANFTFIAASLEQKLTLLPGEGPPEQEMTAATSRPGYCRPQMGRMHFTSKGHVPAQILRNSRPHDMSITSVGEISSVQPILARRGFPGSGCEAIYFGLDERSPHCRSSPHFRSFMGLPSRLVREVSLRTDGCKELELRRPITRLHRYDNARRGEHSNAVHVSDTSSTRIRRDTDRVEKERAIRRYGPSFMSLGGKKLEDLGLGESSPSSIGDERSRARRVSQRCRPARGAAKERKPGSGRRFSGLYRKDAHTSGLGVPRQTPPRDPPPRDPSPGARPTEPVLHLTGQAARATQPEHPIERRLPVSRKLSIDVFRGISTRCPRWTAG
ncbi:unnamed protein product [Diplocarpon coronariae]